MPVAGQDAVGDGAPMERKAHVRTTVVDRVHFVADGEETKGVPVDVDDEPSRRSQIGKRRGADQTFRCERGHRFLLFHQ
jgi:hypothetical protein